MFVVICYDVSDDRRRARLANLLQESGSRVQESVFECLVSDSELAEIGARAALMLSDGDRIRYYRICPKCLGKAKEQGGPPFLTEPLAYFV